MNLAVNIGDTRVKAGFFKSGNIVGICWEGTEVTLLAAFVNTQTVDRVLIISANKKKYQIIEYICSTAAFQFLPAQTPLLIKHAIPLVCNTTELCLQSGVFYSLKNGIAGNIREYHEKFGQINVIFCVGDANFFESSIKATIFVNQYLALIGLNKILEGL